MDKKYGEFVGVDNLYIALVTQDSATGYIAGAPEYLAPAAEIAGEPEISNKTTYYDNKPANTYVTEGKTELKITVSNVPAKLAAKILGKSYNEATGRVYDSGEANPPDFALGFRYSLGSSDFRYYWFLKGTFSGGAEEASSKSNDVDVKTYTLTFTAVPTTKQWTIDAVLKSLKRVLADTTDDAFDATGWFTQVQTPDTVGTPAALALSSSDPADAETDVAVDSNLTLTYNNAIEDYSITVVDTTTLTAIAVTIQKDATNKIITITPDDDLDASTNYAIVVAKVKDTYGQTLANTVIDFTTVA